MFNKVFRSLLIAHSFENDIYTLAPRKFSRWHKISVCRYDYNLIDLPLEG